MRPVASYRLCEDAVRLIPIEDREDAAQILWDLLAQREPWQNISHKKMPTWEEHLAFLAAKNPGRPLSYDDWCLIENKAGTIVGAIYLDCNNELGPDIFRAHQRQGYGEAAVKAMMEKHGARRYLWNLNPKNLASAALAKKLGFRVLQHTYALEPNG